MVGQAGGIEPNVVSQVLEFQLLHTDRKMLSKNTGLIGLLGTIQSKQRKLTERRLMKMSGIIRKAERNSNSEIKPH